jgi:hypothetical protein
LALASPALLGGDGVGLNPLLPPSLGPLLGAPVSILKALKGSSCGGSSVMTETEFNQLSKQGYNRIPLMLEAFADLETRSRST